MLRAYSELGQVTEQETLASISDPQARDVIVQLVDLEETATKKNYAQQLAGALRFLEKYKSDSEASAAKAHLLASGAGQATDAWLKEFQEKAMRTRTGAGAFLKGLRRTKRTEARLDG